MSFKRFYSTLFFIPALLFFVPFSVFAQETTTTGQVWRCLHKQEKEYKIHAKFLKGEGFPVNQEIYIVSSTSTANGVVNTSGDKTVDELLGLGPNDGSIIMKFVEGGPRMKTADGVIKVVIKQDSTPAMKRRPVRYYGVYFPTVQPTQTQGADNTGNTGGQQQGTIDIGNETSGGSSDETCASMVWDPEGRVFDAKSLEPIQNVRVSVLDTAKKPLVATGVVNPTDTDAAGIYSFFVPEGEYYLKVTYPSTYRMVSGTNEINANYSKAYYQIYNVDELIVEKIDTPKETAQGYPDVEHRDVALISDSKTTVNPLTIMSHAEAVLANQYVCTGQVSHPLSKITILQNGSVLYTGTVDKYGYYDVKFDTSKINSSLPIDINFEKTDLTSNLTGWINRFLKLIRVNAQESPATIRTQPILRQIKGYAYGPNKSPLANATVKVRLQNNNEEFYRTKTDTTGYFAIDSLNLPIFPYYLEYVNSNGIVTKQQTSQFVSDNSQFLKEQKVQVEKDPYIKEVPTLALTKEQLSDNLSRTSELMLLVVFILLLLLSIGLIVHFVQKQSMKDKKW